MTKIGIIGSGVMGTDVAQAFAQNHFQVVVVDKNPEQLKKSKEKIKTNLRFQKIFLNSHPHFKIDKLLSYEQLIENIHFTSDINHLKEMSYIIENVTEDWETKKIVHTQLEEVIPIETIVAVNTSAISITRIGSLKKCPQNVVGVHFMNPAHIMPTVEVIKGYHTSDDTLQKTQELLLSIGKKSLVVKDSPGFITNRAMMIFVNEAIYCLSEGIASAEDIDILFKECFGHKMGPLQTADLIGLDTILRSLEVLYQSFNDDKYRPCIRLKQMVDAGLLGMKSGQGFYIYS